MTAAICGVIVVVVSLTMTLYLWPETQEPVSEYRVAQNNLHNIFAKGREDIEQKMVVEIQRLRRENSRLKS